MCVNELATDEVAELEALAARDGPVPPADDPYLGAPGSRCVPYSPAVAARFASASTSVEAAAGASAAVDELDAAIARAVGLYPDGGGDADGAGRAAGADDAAEARVAYRHSTASQLLHYARSPDADAAAGAAYALHTDCADYVGGESARFSVEKHSERAVTALLYLTDPDDDDDKHGEEGGATAADGGGATAAADGGAEHARGETVFPLLGLAVAPKAGRLLLFETLDPRTGRCDPLAAHVGGAPRGRAAAEPGAPGGGAKEVLQKWYHAAPLPPGARRQDEARPGQPTSSKGVFCDLNFVCREWVKMPGNGSARAGLGVGG